MSKLVFVWLAPSLAPVASSSSVVVVVVVGIAAGAGFGFGVGSCTSVVSVPVPVPVPVPQHLPGLPQDVLDELRVRLWTATALRSTFWLNFWWLFFLLVVGLHLGAGQVGQQGGGDGVQPVEPRQFILEDFSTIGGG